MGLSIVAIEMLKQKKKSLQLKQRITNKIEVELECWLEIYNLLNQNQIPFEIIYIVETQEYDFQKGLQSCISKINVSGKVVVFFGRVSPVIILPISDLLNIINNIDLPLYETIYLTDENFNWLIFCSHKQDWYAGYKT